MAKAKGLTYVEFIALAKENYNNGGDVVVECWEEYQFNSYVEMFGQVIKSEALRMFKQYKEQEKEQMAMSRW